LKAALRDCAGPIGYGAIFGLARTGLQNNGGTKWSCDLDPSGAGDDGIICRWPTDPNIKVQQFGLRTNFNAPGSSVQLSAVPGAQNGTLLIASITFVGTAPAPAVPAGWSVVPGADVTTANKRQRTMVWYHITGNSEPMSYTWTWNSIANPAGGITAWTGINSSPFDGSATVKSGVGTKAAAPVIKTHFANTRLLSIYGAGNATLPSFGLPEGPNGVGINETGALNLHSTPGGSVYAHLVGDRIQPKAGDTIVESVQINQDKPPKTDVDWTAISVVIRPSS
jgi:hypothetical protein